MMRFLSILLAAAAIAAPASAAKLTYIGEKTFPTGYVPLGAAGTVEGVTAPLGGLSGIDYDAASGDYVVISDDRSQFAPARYYRFSLDIDAGGFTAATATSVTALRQPDGTLYPEFRIGPLLRARAQLFGGCTGHGLQRPDL